MFERLWLKDELENKYFHIFIFGVVLTIISLLLTNYILPIKNGLVAVFLVSLAAAYPLVAHLRVEEEEEEKLIKKHKEKNLLKRHENELMIYLSFFLGVMIVFVAAGFLLPNSFFSPQNEIVKGITGFATFQTGNSVSVNVLSSILSNNLIIFLLAFALSFVISAGMVFILVWNASVLGVFLSKIISANPLIALSYLPHGLLEISGFVLAGIAGALLSHQFEHFKRGHHKKSVFRGILKDIGILLFIGVIVIIIGGLIETFVLQIR
jgi:uncharacterized membrane protein SpoIIM required for sporulation